MQSKLTYRQAARLVQPVYAIWHSLLDLLYPPRCIGCGRVDTLWCDHCQHRLEQIPYSAPSRHTQNADITMLLTATAPHNGLLRDMIHAIKYENATPLAYPLGARLAHHIQQQDWSIDALVPVPLHDARRRKRGYNQAELLAQVAAEQLGITMMPHALSRVHFNRPQVGLSAKERQANVAEAFVANPTAIKGQRILLVDDVLTTGATLQACASALLTGGASAVYGVTLTAAT